MPRGHLETFDRELFAKFLAKSGKPRSVVAVDCGVGKSTISHWLVGRSKPSPAVVPRLAASLGVGVLKLSGKTMATADLADLRLIHGLTTRQAAQRSGIELWHVQLLEEAIIMPKPAHLEALSPVYGVSDEQIRRSWLNRRMVRFGSSSFAHFDPPTRAYFADLLTSFH